MAETVELTVVDAPDFLSLESRIWWADVCSTFVLEPHHVMLLTAACGAWDRLNEARELLDVEGLTSTDKYLRCKPHPAINVERDSRLAFARLLRELDLDSEPAAASRRPPALQSNRR